MELLVWHEALGCDDEQASEAEALARLLYAYSSAKPSPAPPSWQLQALNLMQGLAAFASGVRRRDGAAAAGISVTLARRRMFIREVEPQVFMSLTLEAEDPDQELRDAHDALLRDLYETFCLFFGSFQRQLERPPPSDQAPLANGMELLSQLQSTRKRLRKLRIAMELEQDASTHDVAVQQQQQQLQQQIEALEAVAPTRQLWSHCDALFPTLLQELLASPLNVFHELQGLTYFPMDDFAVLSLQTFVNSLVAELDADVALFYKGSVLWRAMPSLRSLLVLQRFLRLREQHGMALFVDAVDAA
ncbi:hypothetical protein ATCC90586_011376 [Pythium insidiosum]|nr:hypothetical protein ATCC90586_011376 [Pythium insidiosum]